MKKYSLFKRKNKKEKKRKRFGEANLNHTPSSDWDKLKVNWEEDSEKGKTNIDILIAKKGDKNGEK